MYRAPSALVVLHSSDPRSASVPSVERHMPTNPRLCRSAAATVLLLCASARAQFNLSTAYPGAFTDIGVTGAAVGNSTGAFTSSVVNALMPTPNLFASVAGYITTESFFNFLNTPLPAATSSFNRALFPYWDDLRVDFPGTLKHQALVENGINVHVIQWSQVRRATGSLRGTFQVKLFASGPVLAQFIYPDVAFGGGGASATIGVQWSSTAAAMFSFNTPSLTPGLVISVLPPYAQLAACCIPYQPCALLDQPACTASGGTYAGPGIACAEAECPQPGGCCFVNASCMSLVAADCRTQGGVYQGPGSTCSAACPTVPAVVLTNCNLPTGASTLTGVAAPTGSFWSECAAHDESTWPVSANTVAGFAGWGEFRLADDFVVPPAGLSLAYVRIPVYRTGATGLEVTSATIRIWNGRPDDPGAQVVFGDTSTDRLAYVEFSNIYRIFSTIVGPTCGALTAPGLQRRLRWAYIRVFQNLPPGTYWLDLSYLGGLFSPPATHPTARRPQCDSANANARQFNGEAWVDLVDAAQGCAPIPHQQDLYFELLGGPTMLPCYPNCDGGTAAPILSINDFTCFLQRFAAGDPYANCDNSVSSPVLNVGDFTCFLQRFAAGCP
jgi:hypothetical protein